MSVIVCPLCQRHVDSDRETCETVTIPGKRIENQLVCGRCFEQLGCTLKDEEREGVLHHGRSYPMDRESVKERECDRANAWRDEEVLGLRPLPGEWEDPEPMHPDAAEAIRNFADALSRGDFRTAIHLLHDHKYFTNATPETSRVFFELGLSLSIDEILEFYRPELRRFASDEDDGLTRLGLAVVLLRDVRPQPSPLAARLIEDREDARIRALDDFMDERGVELTEDES